jgi:hypothetical protein
MRPGAARSAIERPGFCRIGIINPACIAHCLKFSVE